MGGRLSAQGVVLLGSLLLMASVAQGQPPPPDDRSARAARHRRLGQEHYDQGRYEEAVREFRRAHALEPQPELLYSLGQAERRRGDCNAALVYYRSFVAVVRDPAQVEAAQLQILRCEQLLAAPSPTSAPAGATQPATQPVAQPAVVSPPPSRDQQPTPSGWRWQDPLAGLLAGGAVAGLVTGTVLIALAGREVAPEGYATYGDYESALDRRSSRWIGGAVALAGGAALMVAALLRYQQPAAPRVDVGVGRGTAMVTLGSRF